MDASPIEGPRLESVMREMQSILASPFFRTSKRSQQFLAYVVNYRLEGNVESLKERTIGADLFNRPADYATGDDSVVRVQAGEVRRRLEQYYQALPANPIVRIELPLGSYAVEFRWASAAISSPSSAPAESTEPEPHSVQPLAPTETASVPISRRRKVWISGLLAGSMLLLSFAGFWIYRARSPKFFLEQFWSPAFASSKPLLICLPKPICYRPSIGLFNRGGNIQASGPIRSRSDEPAPSSQTRRQIGMGRHA